MSSSVVNRQIKVQKAIGADLNGPWRFDNGGMCHNEELHSSCRSSNVVWVIQSRTLWASMQTNQNGIKEYFEIVTVNPKVTHTGTQNNVVTRVQKLRRDAEQDVMTKDLIHINTQSVHRLIN